MSLNERKQLQLHNSPLCTPFRRKDRVHFRPFQLPPPSAPRPHCIECRGALRQCPDEGSCVEEIGVSRPSIEPKMMKGGQEKRGVGVEEQRDERIAVVREQLRRE